MSRTALPVVFWSRAGAHGADPALREPAAAKLPSPRLPLAAGGRFYAGRLSAPAVGTVVLLVRSHRPLRITVAGALVVEEELSWRLYQRELRLAVLAPVAVGDVPLLLEVGEKPRHPENIDHECPSRNRERVMSAIAARHPDEIEIEAWIEPGARLPAMSLRFEPSQCVKGGVIWQRVHVRAAAREAPPGTGPRWFAEEASAGYSLDTPVEPGAAWDVTPEEWGSSGYRRLLVPVAPLSSPPPPVRGNGPEPSRVEPEVEIAAHTVLRVGGRGGSVEVSMPVYEFLGRRAPAREFRELAWPDLDRLRAAVPEPMLPPQWSHFAKLYDYTWDMLLRLVRRPRPESGLPNSYVATALRTFLDHQFVWDSSFTAIVTSYGWRALHPYATLDLLYSRQFDGGYIHREHDVRDGLPALYEPDFSPNPPMMAVAEWALFCITADLGRLRQVYPLLAASHAWLRHNRRLPDGTYWTTGLANGLDNSPSLGDGYPCLTSQMAHQAELLGLMAERLGNAQDAVAYRVEREAIARACNERLWSHEQRIYATSLPGGGHNPNKVATAFWPLWAGIVPADRAADLARHLKDPASFWRHHPVPSLAADSPHYRPGGDYWLGSTWAPTNYATIKGFARAGHRALAAETAVRHLQCLFEVLQDTGSLWENYSAEASRRGSWSGPDYCWTALGPIALLLEVLLGFEPLAQDRVLVWHLPETLEPMGVRRYPLGPATVSAMLMGREGVWQALVQTDRPVTLRLERGGVSADHACGIGMTAIGLG
jgi:hypothetical protein